MCVAEVSCTAAAAAADLSLVAGGGPLLSPGRSLHCRRRVKVMPMRRRRTGVLRVAWSRGARDFGCEPQYTFSTFCLLF